METNERQKKIQECREIYQTGKRAQTGDHVITKEEEELIYRYAGVDIGSILFAEIDQLNSDHAFVLKLYEDLLVDFKTMDSERRTLRNEKAREKA